MSALSIENLFGIRGYVALVTGGSSGLGFMISKGLVANGVKVYVVALATEPIDEKVAELNTLGLTTGGSAVGLEGGRLGKDDGRGAVILTSSCASMHNATNVDLTSYATSKAATDHLVKLLAAKFNRFYVRVVGINPGFVPSNMNPVGEAGNMFSSLFDRVPAKRAGNEEDIAGSVIYLVSRAGSYVDGVSTALRMAAFDNWLKFVQMIYRQFICLGEEDHVSATYPVAFVRNLEERVRELEAQQIQPALDVPQQHPADHEAPESVHLSSDSAIGGLDTADDSLLAKDGLPRGEQPLSETTCHGEHVNMERRPTTALSQAGTQPRTPQRAQETLAENLRSVSLAAVAEPYLGSISGLTFAKLTQAVLRRLSPDGRDFVFSPDVGGSTGTGPISGATNLHLDFMNNMYFDFDQVIDFSMLAGDGTMPTFDDEAQITITTLPDRAEVALEAIMLQVSYSFFNQLGPNTWFLVGTAARLAIGMGLHCDQTLQNLTNAQVERRKRLFFSIFMMDRLVSITLGRPFAIHEDDIDIVSFSITACDELDHGFSTTQSSLCQPPLAITQHILRLRQIANDIATKVYCKRVVARYSAEQRQEVINSIHRDLVNWRQSVPFPLPNLHPRVPQGCLSWYDLNFYTHLTSLYRPSPLFPTLDISRVNILVEAAAMSIRHANSMYLQKRFSFNWLNLLVIYNAVIALVYSVTVQPENLAASLERLRAIDDLELATELFNVLGQKFTASRTIGSMVSQIIERYRLMSSGATY
ncbi:hypothetical protein MBLNU13_g09612t2 [Cladosporium sp. NU13]